MKKKRMFSFLLAIMMVCLLIPAPVYAAEPDEEQTPSVSIVTEEVTNETASLTVSLENRPTMGIFRVVELDADADYEESRLNDYTCLYFGLPQNMQDGENTLELAGVPTAGKKLLAVVRDSSSEPMRDYVSQAVLVAGADSGTHKTYDEVMANCSVTLMENGEIRTSAFLQTETSVDVSVKLDDTIESCYLNIYAYPGNTGFDDESTYNRRLWSGEVTAGYTGTCAIDLSGIPTGYKVIGCLNVPLNKEDLFYRSSTSQTLEVLDENGEGFKDYTYPDAFIVEDTLEEGAASLHISLTGDERLFEYARNKQISIYVSVAQYPEGESFDFESSSQISLLGNYEVTEPFENKEITFETPLKAGYRVRAVVYWTQNVDLFLPKGNDYEAVFGRPDDSVKIVSQAVVALPDTIFDTDKSLELTLTGQAPEGAMVLVKAYDKDTEVFSYDQGTPMGVALNVTPGTFTFNPTQSLSAGTKLVAYLLSGGETVAQSAPVTVASMPDFTVEYNGVITTETNSLDVTITPKTGMESSNLNIVSLCRVESDGSTGAYVARAFGQKPGTVSLTGIQGLGAGDKVRFVIVYNNGSSTLESRDYTVTAPVAADTLVIHETEFTTASTEASVTVSGCEDFVGCRLFLTTGTSSTNDYADGRTSLGSQEYTGSGTYTFTFESSKLKGGNTIQAYLYRYDADTDRTYYQYSNAVDIAKDPVQASVQIVTQNITTETTAVWVSAEFEESALVGLYSYSGDTFALDDPDDFLAVKYLPSAPVGSQKLDLSEVSLNAGEKLIAVLFRGGISGEVIAQSAPVAIEAAPEKEPSVAYIRDTDITAGMTRVNVTTVYDSRVQSKAYVLYQFDGETLDKETAAVISSGSGVTNGQWSIYVGIGHLKAGSKLQLAFITDGTEILSNVVTVQPSPDWGTPYAAFDVSAVKTDAASIDVVIDYADEYIAMGDDFYCDVTIYEFPANYTDEEFEDNELWENFNICKSVAKINSNYGDETRGSLTIPIRDGVTLNAGDRLAIKLRLPHVEWEGEEVDYVSASVPIISADETVASPMVLLYNLSEDKSMGRRLRSVLDGLGISAVDVTYEQLGETVGYLARMDGYEASEEAYTGQRSDAEFMLMANMPEALLDRFLAAMTENGIFIANKAVTTAYNVEYEFHELIDDIEEEHQVFQALLELDDLIDQAEELTEAEYGQTDQWQALQDAIRAGNETLATYEPSLEELEDAISTLKTAYLAVSGKTEMSGMAVIELTEQADGNYTLTASVQGKDSTYVYNWNSGETGPVLTDVPADKLITKIVTVTADGQIGSLSARLAVPDEPRISVTAGSDSLSVTVEPDGEKVNCPAAESYVARLYKDGQLIDQKEFTGTTVEFTGLEEVSAYTVKVTAMSPVGSSDTASETGLTEKEEPEKPGTDPGEKPGTDPEEQPGTKPGTGTEEQPGTNPGTGMEEQPGDLAGDNGDTDQPQTGENQDGGLEHKSHKSHKSGNSSDDSANTAAEAVISTAEESPKTGDDTSVILYVMLLALAAAGTAVWKREN